MKKMSVSVKIMLLQVLLLLIFVGTGYSNSNGFFVPDPREQSLLSSVTLGTNKFAVNLYRMLAREQGRNLFVSPISVQVVLALATMGARGDTLNELGELLTLPYNPEKTLLGYSTLIKTLANKDIQLINELILPANAFVKPDFRYIAERFFRAEPMNVPFQNNTEGVRYKINSLVNTYPVNKIENTYPPWSIDKPGKSTVLASTVYFNDIWRQPFSYVRPGIFHTSLTNQIYVPMLHFNDNFHFVYDEELRAKIIELKFDKIFLSMVVILPDDINGLSAIEENLESLSLLDRIVGMPMRRVSVVLPKFSLENTIDLKNSLKSLGVHKIFDRFSADFKGITDTPVFVSEIFQKAIISVDQQGVTFSTRSGRKMRRPQWNYGDQTEFIANHPFFFFIQFDGIILFFGRINE